MAFHQDPPRLGDTYAADPLLREHLARTLPAAALAEIEPELSQLGALAGGPLFELQAADRLSGGARTNSRGGMCWRASCATY